jgi:hypothetical protein
MKRPRREQSDPRFIRDWIKEGRGQNCLYEPWLYIQDAPSNGNRARVNCPKVGNRTFRVISALEIRWLFILEFVSDPEVQKL